VQHTKPRDHGAIESAIAACMNGECLQSGSDSTRVGTPPPVGPHGASVLWARVCATELDWDRCAAALRHGTAPPDCRKKPKPKTA
jgi:hypothetical protein